MKNNKKWIIGIGAVVIIGGGIIGYNVMNQSLGNNVEIQSVVPAQSQPTSTEAASGSTAVQADQINGDWNIAEGSKVYWSVTTSRETVNFEDAAVTGKWTLNVNDPSASTGEGTVDLSVLSSGNEQRDEHVKAADFLDISQYPEATFKATSFSELPQEWTEGTAVPFEMNGVLTVKGVDKDVVFQSQAVYNEGKLMLSGTTKVTFSDFGLTNPHNVVLETENEFTVQLELILAK